MIISVASGKGGTGKTTIAINLALSISKNTKKKKVSFFDCDVEEPNAHIFLKPTIELEHYVEIPIPQVDEEKCTYCGECARICHYHSILVLKDKVMIFPELCHGCGGCTLFCPAQAITEKGRIVGTVKRGSSGNMRFTSGLLYIGEMLSPTVIRSVKKYIEKDRISIIDSPPGTSCPFVESVKGSEFCILVTEPTPFGLNDLKITLQVIGELNIPVGVIINKSSDGQDIKIEEFCRNADVDILMKIPWDKEIAKGYSIGVPLIESHRKWQKKFNELFEIIKLKLSKAGTKGLKQGQKLGETAISNL